MNSFNKIHVDFSDQIYDVIMLLCECKLASSPREHKLHQYLLKDPLAEGTAGLLDVSW